MAVDHVARNMAMDAGGGAAPVDITQIVTEAVSKIVADAPEDFDTLRELYDWLTQHEDSAAAMNSAIMQNAEDIEETNALLGTKPGVKSTSAENAEVFNDLVGNIAIGVNSHAEGGGCTASGTSSHAEGAGGIASGNFSHSEGGGCTASGASSHAEGSGSTASGNYSHAEGGASLAQGEQAHAEGGGCTASGESSHAEGKGTIASGVGSHVQGIYNVEDTDGKFAHIIGNGSSMVRHNAFAIDWQGKIYVNGSTTGVNVEDLLNRIIALEEEVAALQA